MEIDKKFRKLSFAEPHSNEWAGEHHKQGCWTLAFLRGTDLMEEAMKVDEAVSVMLGIPRPT